MFCKKSDFEKIEGFNKGMKVLEDADLSIRMNALGRIVQLKQKVISSDRRVKEWGFLTSYFRYLRILFSWIYRKNRDIFDTAYEDIR